MSKIPQNYRMKGAKSSAPKRRRQKPLNKGKTPPKPKRDATLSEWRQAIDRASRRQLNSWIKTTRGLHSGRVVQAIRAKQGRMGYERQTRKSSKVSPVPYVKRSSSHYEKHLLTYVGLRNEVTYRPDLVVKEVWITLRKLPAKGLVVTRDLILDRLPTSLIRDRLTFAVLSIGSSASNKADLSHTGNRMEPKDMTNIPRILKPSDLAPQQFSKVLRPGEELNHRYGLPLPFFFNSLKQNMAVRIKIALQQGSRDPPRFIGLWTPLSLAWRKLNATFNKQDAVFRLPRGSIFLLFPKDPKNQVIFRPKVERSFVDDKSSESSEDPYEEHNEEKEQDKDKEVLALQKFYKELKGKKLQNDQEAAMKRMATKASALQYKTISTTKAGKFMLDSKQYDCWTLKADSSLLVSLSIEMYKGKAVLKTPTSKWVNLKMLVML